MLTGYKVKTLLICLVFSKNSIAKNIPFVFTSGAGTSEI